MDNATPARGWAILAAAAFLLASGSANALDCAKPGAPAAAVVCSDKGLQRLLHERETAYRAARGRANPAERKALADDRRHWLKSYEAACGVPAAGKAQTLDAAVIHCFAHAYEARTASLRAYPPQGAAPAAASAAKPAAAAAQTPASGPATVGFAFTFACRTPDKLKRVLHALAASDMSYPLSQSDCLPLVKGRAVQVLATDGRLARIRLCSKDAGCIELYANAASIMRGSEAPAGK
ncbi:MAG: hypothetical protein ACREFA_11380 [Stellaceae bacterium]